MYKIIDFYADWCAPCKMISPKLEELNNERDDLTLEKIDVGENPEKAQENNITGIPTIKIFKDNQEIKTFIGNVSKENIEEILKSS